MVDYAAMVTIVDRDEYPVAWREAGSGRVALFLHGLGGSRTSWDPQLSALAPLRRCVAWDMPGYGASPGRPFSLEDLADAAAQLVKTLDSGPVDVVGLSMGGMIAQHLALRHPHLVRTLALLDTSPAFGLDGTGEDEWLASRLGSLQGHTTAEIAPSVISGIVGPQCGDECRAAAVAAMSRIPTESLVAACAALVRHDLRDRLDEIRVPVTVVVGEDDHETPVSYARVLADGIQGARLHVIEACGHLSNVEQPRRVNAQLEQLWASTEKECM